LDAAAQTPQPALVLSRTFKQADSFEEADIEKRPVLFLYGHRGEYMFCDIKDRSKRFPISADVLGDKTEWLKPNTEITAVVLNDESEEKVISIILPIKMDLKVTEAPPGLKGDTAQGGTKPVVLETGATVAAPLFINSGDIIRVNTETGEYAERVQKG
jgi:elongation factor P